MFFIGTRESTIGSSSKLLHSSSSSNRWPNAPSLTSQVSQPICNSLYSVNFSLNVACFPHHPNHLIFTISAMMTQLSSCMTRSWKMRTKYWFKSAGNCDRIILAALMMTRGRRRHSGMISTRIFRLTRRSWTTSKHSTRRRMSFWMSPLPILIKRSGKLIKSWSRMAS